MGFWLVSCGTKVTQAKHETNGLLICLKLFNSNLRIGIHNDYNTSISNLITLELGLISVLVQLFNSDRHFRVVSCSQLNRRLGERAEIKKTTKSSLI